MPTLPVPSALAPRPPFAEVEVGGERVALLRDGEQAYPAMLEAIAAARRTVCLETYILRDDATGQRFFAALSERARAGVLVLLMYDAWGSDVAEASLAKLAEAGVKVSAFRPFRIVRSLSRAVARHGRRNHRKSLVVDGRVGFTGGMNVADDYAPVADGGGGWRDTHLRVSGPSARALEALFRETWRRNRGPGYDATRFEGDPGVLPAAGAVRIVGNGFVRTRKEVRRAYEQAFEAARERIFVTNAYFLPPPSLLRRLFAAAKRGVRVAVVLAATTDVKTVLYAARWLYPRLLYAGIELYEWTDGRVLHAKTAVIDGAWTTVGSTNLDTLSLSRNLEVNAIVVDEALGAAAERLFVDDLAHCRRITFDDLASFGPLERALSWLAWRMRSWL